MPENFEFKRDYRRVEGGPTIALNELRAACSGIVLYLIISISSGQWGAWPIMLAIPFGYLLFILPAFFICQALAKRGVSYVGWIALILCLEVVAGDPIVFLLHKTLPRLVPAERFDFINFAVIIFVLRPEPESVLAAGAGMA